MNQDEHARLTAERDEARRQLAETRAREPSEAGGPGHEETYWLRQKLNASVQHLRDVEDFYRLRGGSELSHNMVRADRARSLYEQITEDFVNGKLSRPTMRERAESAVAERDRLRDALRQIQRIDEWLDGAVAETYKDQPLAQDWARVAKTVEEAGEAVEALIALTGQNPRKPQRDEARQELIDELADVALTAVLAIQHFEKDSDATAAIVRDRLSRLYERAALAESEETT